MKRLLFVVLFGLLFAACGGEDNNKDQGVCPASNLLCLKHEDHFWSDISSMPMSRDKGIAYCLEMWGRLPDIRELRELIKDCPSTEVTSDQSYPLPEDVCQVDYYADTWGLDEKGFCLDRTCRDQDLCKGCTFSQFGDHAEFGLSGMGNDGVEVWSSSIVTDAPSMGWYVDFGTGGIYVASLSDSNYVRCVR